MKLPWAFKLSSRLSIGTIVLDSYFLHKKQQSSFSRHLKGLFHPTCLARVISWFAFVVAIFMGRENDGKQRPTKRRHMQGMLDETDPLNLRILNHSLPRFNDVTTWSHI